MICNTKLRLPHQHLEIIVTLLTILFEDQLQPGSIPMLWCETADDLLNQKPIAGRSLKDVVPGDTVTEVTGVTSGGTILVKTAKYPNGALLVPA